MHCNVCPSVRPFCPGLKSIEDSSHWCTRYHDDVARAAIMLSKSNNSRSRGITKLTHSVT